MRAKPGTRGRSIADALLEVEQVTFGVGDVPSGGREIAQPGRESYDPRGERRKTHRLVGGAQPSLAVQTLRGQSRQFSLRKRAFDVE